MTWRKRERKIRLALLLDSSQGCASERQTLKGRLPLALKYLEKSTLRGLAQDEEAQKSLAVITVDSSERASDALSALEDASQDAFGEACASLEEGVPTEGPPDADGVVGEAPSEIAARLSFSVRLANAGPRRKRMPNRLVLGSYVLPQEWDSPLADAVALGPEVAREVVDLWSLFTKHRCSTSTPLFSEYL